MQIVELKCHTCSETFIRSASLHKSNLKRGRVLTFCKPACTAKGQVKEVPSYVCKACGNTFSRRKSGSEDKLLFCNTACSNFGRQRRKKPKPVRAIQTRAYVWEDITLAELRAAVPSVSRYHAKLRGYSRRAYKGPSSCAACSYSTHVEIAHIVSAKTFDPSTKLSVVNAPTNLVALCRNCHWEFDNGILTYDVDNKVWKVL